MILLIPVTFPCDHCGEAGGRCSRQNTAYEDLKLNYATLCERCQDEADEYWAEMWADLHRGCL